ncbi:hypothetical protein PoB_005624700 [Plakobranchus ocellatus]|uniref:C-type lectin domain-containing protein n=1 Tax=Plakobranchus ocellatus TaxID=259542 RepID=A0AAV4CDZ2_9GAST|nr:hypothetical protein PoB_005624700 [Plakobranchus ocellatus]
MASPQQGDLRLLGPPSGRGADGEARTLDRRVPADLRSDSQATVPPSPCWRGLQAVYKLEVSCDRAGGVYYAVTRSCLVLGGQRMSYEQALLFCHAQNSSLLEIKNLTDDQNLQDLLDILPQRSTGLSWWLGLRAAGQGPLRWRSGAMFSKGYDQVDGASLISRASIGREWGSGASVGCEMNSYHNFSQSLSLDRIAPNSCVAKAPNGTWLLESCHSSTMKETICEKSYESWTTIDEVFPDKPHIKLNYFKSFSRPKVGSVIPAVCSAKVGLKGDLLYVLFSDDRKRKIFLEHDTYPYFQRSEQKLQESGACIARADGYLPLQVTDDMSGLNLACLSMVNDNVEMCSNKDPFCTVFGSIDIQAGPTGTSGPILKECIKAGQLMLNANKESQKIYNILGKKKEMKS